MKQKPSHDGLYQQTHFFEQERERLHRSVLSSVSHDLKTPLSCVIGSLEIYEHTKEKLTDDTRNTLIHTALHQAYRLDSFISNILDMAKLENSEIKVRNETCEMDLLLEDCLILVGRRLAGCEITITATPSTFTVTTDPFLLTRAISIVLDNAARYSVSHPMILMEYEMDGDRAILRISDNGPGIEPAKLGEIFAKHSRLAGQDTQNAATGLGLPICHEIMKLLGGTITAENQANGKGALFTLTFPA